MEKRTSARYMPLISYRILSINHCKQLGENKPVLSKHDTPEWLVRMKCGISDERTNGTRIKQVLLPD